MKERIQILNIISCNSNYPALGVVNIQESDLMFTHGSNEEFTVMISEIEAAYNILFLAAPARDIGEMTVKQFVDDILEAIHNSKTRKEEIQMNKIEFEINNNRRMRIAQEKYDGTCTVSKSSNTTGEVDHEEKISAGDMVMLINYYRHVKSNNIQCPFINPIPTKST